MPGQAACATSLADVAAYRRKHAIMYAPSPADRLTSGRHSDAKALKMGSSSRPRVANLRLCSRSSRASLSARSKGTCAKHPYALGGFLTAGMLPRVSAGRGAWPRVRQEALLDAIGRFAPRHWRPPAGPTGNRRQVRRPPRRSPDAHRLSQRSQGNRLVLLCCPRLLLRRCRMRSGRRPGYGRFFRREPRGRIPQNGWPRVRQEALQNASGRFVPRHCRPPTGLIGNRRQVRRPPRRSLGVHQLSQRSQGNRLVLLCGPRPLRQRCQTLSPRRAGYGWFRRRDARKRILQYG